MKIQCEIIRDLIPLMEDDVCSEQSKAAVLEHIKKCEECRKIYENAKISPAFVLSADEKKEKEVVKKGCRKIKIKYRVSLIAVLLIVPILYLSWGQAWGSGIAFTNIDDIYRCVKYLHHIKDGKYDKAVEMVDFAGNDYKLIESVAHMTSDEYVQYMKDRYVSKLQQYEDVGLSIDNIHYDSAYYFDENGGWSIGIAFDEIYPDGSRQKIIVNINAETMYSGGCAYPNKNEIERDDYIDEILHLYSEDESLWYQDYEVTFELKEGEKAVIHRNENSNVDIQGVTNITYGTAGSLIEEPFYQETFEASVPGEYSVFTFDGNKNIKFLTLDEIDIEINKY